jgi:glycosyltransferase involved in cell wall biosynthesis
VKILYVATDQHVPGSTGGSVHVEEVARGLARRGHEVHVVARSAGGEVVDGEFQVHPGKPLTSHRMFRWTAERTVRDLISRLRIDVVLERYYNFAGEGVRAAHRCGVPAVLEVNSPVMDHPGSLKAWIDGAALFRPMKRIREEQCQKASALVTPLPAIVPDTVSREKVHQIHWGANVELFRPGLMPSGAAAEIPIPPDARVVIFSGSFRLWHGADVLVRAGARVLESRDGEKAFFLFIGSGPTYDAIAREVGRLGIESRCHLTGAVPYRDMHLYLSRGHIGVAPYQPSRHGQLELGFYWSPLKIYEYMASGLPVITLDIDPLRDIIRQGRDGLLFDERDEKGLADAMTELVRSPERAREMGRSARERVVAHYSWQVHCEKLERVLLDVIGKDNKRKDAETQRKEEFQ